MPASPHRATRALATLCAGAAGSIVMTAAPAFADPDVDDARERLNAVQEKRDKTSTQARRLSKDLVKAQSALRETRRMVKAHEVALEEVEALILADSEDSLNLEAIADATDVIRADDPSEALAQAREDAEEVSLAPETAQGLEDRIDALREREAKQSGKADKLRAQAKKQGTSLRNLRSRVAAAAERLEQARDAAREAARASRAAARAEAQEAAAAEAAPAASAAPAAPAAPAAAAVSGGAGAAVAYAMAQVGDAYSYGASGPSAFDCSGLTSMAWAQAGVSLPRTSGAQMGAGTPVSTSALQPGDLVFYYSPVSHVGIYVGNGQLVHAANPSTGVQLTSVNSMPISGAVRPG